MDAHTNFTYEVARFLDAEKFVHPSYIVMRLKDNRALYPHEDHVIATLDSLVEKGEAACRTIPHHPMEREYRRVMLPEGVIIRDDGTALLRA